MEVRSERLLDLPVERLQRVLLRGAQAWVPNLDEDEAGGLLTEVGVGSAGAWLGRRVTLWVGEAAAGPDGCAVPITWRAERRPERYPQLRGVLELTPATWHRTWLVLRATYRPPGGVIGELADRAALHRVAEATVRGFVERAAWVLERAA